LFNLGIYEFLMARLDIIEGLQGDAQAQALAEIQQARVRPLLGRGSISAETYQIYLPAESQGVGGNLPEAAAHKGISFPKQVEET
jgi:hypothetical protein